MKLTHGGDWAGYIEEYGKEPLDYSSNVSPLGIPEGVKRAAAEAMERADRYPDPLCRQLKAALSRTWGVPADRILCGNGASDLILRVASGLAPKRALVTAPTFSEYEEALAKAGCACDHFPLKEEGFLSDCLHCKPGTPASKAEPDDHLRPNQLLAITLGLVEDRKLRRAILLNTSELLVPGGIRSLADRPVKYPLPVYGADGKLLNDPNHPYQGHYCGDEDTRRKVAYHNGTAWTWQMPLFPEAYYITHGAFGRATAISLLSSMAVQLDNGCIMHMPEILDGDYPHKPRGCDAQAWGLSEYYRVWKLLHPASKSIEKDHE